MGARAGGAAGQLSGAKGSITGFYKNSKANQLGLLAGKPYSVSYKQNGKKGEQFANFMTKKGADLFTKAVKNGNSVKWSLGIANKVDQKTKNTILGVQQDKAAKKKLSEMIKSGAFGPKGAPVGKTVTVYF